jgi:uncharacterized protein YgiM (DUF1202 family)
LRQTADILRHNKITYFEMDLVSPMLRIATITLLIWTIPIPCLAESVYVGDTLRVGVRAEPDNTSAAHGVVVTGMQLEVQERAHGYLKIRSEGGVEGWIKDSYVTSEKPAKLELSAAQAEQAKLQTQLAEQNKLLKDANAKSAVLAAELQKLTATNTELRTRLNETTQGKTTQVTWLYFGYMLVLLVLGCGGFVAGVVWHRKQAMKRLGGLRV